MTRTYECPIHGQFDHECKMSDPELIQCPHTVEQDYNYIVECTEKLKRIFKPTSSIWKCGGSYKKS